MILTLCILLIQCDYVHGLAVVYIWAMFYVICGIVCLGRVKGTIAKMLCICYCRGSIFLAICATYF